MNIKYQSNRNSINPIHNAIVTFRESEARYITPFLNCVRDETCWLCHCEGYKVTIFVHDYTDYQRFKDYYLSLKCGLLVDHEFPYTRTVIDDKFYAYILTQFTGEKCISMDYLSLDTYDNVQLIEVDLSGRRDNLLVRSFIDEYNQIENNRFFYLADYYDDNFIILYDATSYPDYRISKLLLPIRVIEDSELRKEVK